MADDLRRVVRRIHRRTLPPSCDGFPAFPHDTRDSRPPNMDGAVPLYLFDSWSLHIHWLHPHTLPPKPQTHRHTPTDTDIHSYRHTDTRHVPACGQASAIVLPTRPRPSTPTSATDFGHLCRLRAWIAACNARLMLLFVHPHRLGAGRGLAVCSTG